MQQTSLEAYKEISSELSSRCFQVYKAIREIEPCTLAMISKRMNLPINCITGRVFELRCKYKKVAYAGTNICPVTKHKAMFWRTIN